MEPSPAGPPELDREVVLRDGARVRIRPIRPDDAPRLIDLYGRLSRDTRYQRFFTVMQRLPPDWARFLATVDYRTRFALVVERPAAGCGGAGADALVGVARYEPTSEPGVAEVAFVVEDAWQGRGLGTLLLGELLRAAAANGITAFRAWVLADNRRMLDLLTRFTDVVERRLERGVVELRFRRAPPHARRPR
jgi:RimJ/RimL family protein N-acetyltransferase